VIILCQKNWRIHVGHLLQNCVGEALVNSLVLQPIFWAKDRARVRDVAERPEALIGEAIVVALVFFFREPHAAQRVARAIGRDTQAVKDVDRFAVGTAGAIRDPCAITCQQYRLESRDHAAGRHDHPDSFPRSLEYVHVRLAIGNDEQRLVLKPIAQADAESFRRP